MRIVFTVAFLLWCQVNGHCHADSSKTEVIIIGTIHTGNKYISHKTLYALLDSLKPGIILDEDSEKYKRVPGLKTAKFLRIWKPGIEQMALQTYSRRNRNTIILPYDTSFAGQEPSRKQRKKESKARRSHIKRVIKMEAAVFDSIQMVPMDSNDSLKFATYVANRNDYYTSFGDKDLYQINDPVYYNRARGLYRDDNEIILPMLEKLVKDTLLVQEYRNDQRFWNDRNHYMARKIQSIAEAHPQKRIVVLTGLNHKYFLTEQLSATKSGHFKLAELSKQ
jgi:hypothetical protein